MKHLNLKNTKESMAFTTVSKNGGGKDPYPNRQDELSHIKILQNKFNQVVTDSKVKSFEEREKLYLQITGEPGLRLKFDSLENRKIESKVMNIREIPVQNSTGDVENVEQVVMSLPKKNANKFLKKLEEYEATLGLPNKNPTNNDLVRSISNIEAVILESFWTGNTEWIPTDAEKVWCEIWLIQ